jgi:GNAT superfamily N-acetyltransferase
MLEMIHAQSPQQIQHVRALLTDFVAWDKSMTAAQGFDVDLLEYQYSETGLELPGHFAPRDGRLFLALWDTQPAGCIALHKLDTGIGELKRMYVDPRYRGKGIGRALIQTIITAARELGYTILRLETVSFMTDAVALYHACGFHDIAPYYEIPQELSHITIFMEQEIAPHAEK